MSDELVALHSDFLGYVPDKAGTAYERMAAVVLATLGWQDVAHDVTEQPVGRRADHQLLINQSAIGMVIRGIPEVWKSDRMTTGARTTDLNRQWALHGTARGWSTSDSAIQSVLLVAAAARVAQPLLAPRP